MAQQRQKAGEPAEASAEDEPVAAPEEAPAEAAAPEEAVPLERGQYDKDRLIAEAEGFFGEAPHVVAGALSEETEPLDVEKAKSLIEEWKQKEVT